MAVAPTGGVAVEAQQTQPLQFLGQLLQNPLGAGAERLEGEGSAMATGRFHLGAMVTPVTTQPLPPGLAAMHRESHIAVRTLHHLTTAATTEKTAVAPPRHQHHGLLPPLRQHRQAIHQGTTDQAPMAVLQFCAHVDHMHRWQGLA